ncbi:archaemetzincin-2 [Trematomus bernacchii]|uniref:archaemetzincin-2 n=1 Tax=Trematomus bernacchii TaxID=40690 RepID=UPI001469B13A|nr:archaemetzincin-2 [Trematomus bernacchii]
MKLIQHSVQALQTVLVSNHKDLARLYSKYTKAERHLLEEGFHAGQRPDSLFQPITGHSDSDWISAHPEEHQDFESFYRDPSRKTPNASHNTIYIQTIGSFGKAGAQTDQCVEWLREYCQAFFYGLSVKLLPAVTVAETKCSFRVNSNSHNLQILTGDLLQFLWSRKPTDAFCIVGITMINLYPKDSWNLVFGQASLSNGMRVSASPGSSAVGWTDELHLGSCYKTAHCVSGGPSHSSRKVNSPCKPRVAAVFLVSTNKGSLYFQTPRLASQLFVAAQEPGCNIWGLIMTHEIGHMFGLKPCQWLSCVMQPGSNHLEESDRRPLDFCPVCLRKLQVAIGFKIADQYKALVHWMEVDQTPEEASTCQSLLHFPKPTEAFQTSRLWLHRCLDILRE